MHGSDMVGFFPRNASTAFLLAALMVGLSGCSGIDRVRTGPGAFTLRDADGADYPSFESEAFDACPDGYETLGSVVSPSDGSRFTEWRIRCVTVDGPNGSSTAGR